MLLDRYIKFLKNERNYSVHTSVAYINDVNQFYTHCNVAYQNTKEITVDDVRLWVVALKENGFSTKTINRKISSLKTFFNYCKREGVLTLNPALRIKSLKEKKRLPAVVSELDLEKLLNSDNMFSYDFHGLRDRLIIDLFYQTGIRLSELINIRVSDYDSHEKVLKVLGKRNKERLIPLTESLITLIEDYVQKKNNQFKVVSQFLVVANNGKKSYSKMIYRIVNRYLSMVSSVKKTSPHVLRHAFATHLLNRGADLNAIKELLGHSSLVSTQVYTYVSGEKIKKAYRASHPRG